jgi:tetratricopeptide (TPR) repeat protein
MRSLTGSLAVLGFLFAGQATAQSTGTADGRPTGRLEFTSTSEDAKSELRSAIWNWRHAHAARAVIHLERALSMDPQFGLARMLRGQLKPGLTPAERQEEFDRALEALTKASPVEALIGLAWREQFSGRQPIARPIMEAAGQLVPADPDVALAYYGLRNFGNSREQSIPVWREAIQRFPQVPQFHRELGYALFFLGDRPAGIAAMQEYVRLDPRHANTHESLAELYQRDGKLTEAVQYIQTAIALDSAYGSSYALLAYARLDAGDFVGARSQWMKAIQVALNVTDSVDFSQSLALNYLIAGNSKDAIRQLAEVATLAESRRLTASAILIHQRMAVIEAFYGDPNNIGGHLSRAASLSGSNSAAQHIHAAIAFAAARQLDLARASTAKFAAVATDANRLTLHTLNGFIALQANNPALAYSELRKAASNDVFAKQLLAESQTKGGNLAGVSGLRDEVTKAPFFPQGVVRVPDVFTIIAKQRAKAI